MLEELELLSKAWRRRVDHPYTAHIESPSGAGAGGDWLREGEDYSSSDYEYESDDEDYLKTSKTTSQEINESLSKKKFCQSAKVFYQLFSSKAQHDSFQRFVSKTKKAIFRLIFGMFLSSIPEETKYKMPDEIWEKIWSRSQNSYFKFQSSIPIGSDQSYMKVGLRSAAKPELSAVEKERIKDMFAAFGNLHMLVFEIMYKNPHLLQPSPQLELEVGSLSDNYGVAVWKESVQQARTAVLKFHQLDSIFTGNKSMKEGIGHAQQIVDTAAVEIQLQRGLVHIRDTMLGTDEALTKGKVGPAASLLVSEGICSFICLPSNYTMEDGRLGLLLLIINVEDNCKIVHKIRTPIRHELFLIEVGSHRVIRNNESGWKKSFYLTQNRLSFVFKSEEKGVEIAKVYTTTLGGDECEITINDCLVETRISSFGGDNLRPSRSATHAFVSHNNSQLVLLHQSPYCLQTTLSVHCLQTGETHLSVPFNDSLSMLSACCPTRVLLKSQKKCILLFSLLSGEVIHHWNEADLNRTLNIAEDSKWKAVFDSSSSKPQLCLFTGTMSGFSLIQFDPNNEMERPKTSVMGSIAEGVTGLGTSARLMNGNLFTNTNQEWLGMSGGVVKGHLIACFSLVKKNKFNVLSMSQSSSQSEEPILNVMNRHWVDECSGLLWDPEKRPLFAMSKSKFGILLEQGGVCRTIDLGLSSLEIVNAAVQ